MEHGVNDPTTPLTYQQSAARYNEEAAAAAIAQQMEADTASFLAQIEAIKQTINRSQ